MSSEAIIIRDSCEIEVSSTDTQVAVSLQVAIQAAIVLVINLTMLIATKQKRSLNNFCRKLILSN
ncbi:spore coat protein [Metabacillus sp. HB246100]